MKRAFLLCLSLGLISSLAFGADALDAATQARVDAQVKEIRAWGTSPALVKAVREHNASLPADSAAMSQDKWKGLTVLDPFVRSFAKNDAGGFLKSKKGDVVGEAFASGADGLKVGFLSKPSNWSHKGKPKHDLPMAGKSWQGTPEVDESTGLVLVQVSVPVLDGDKPIGSLVVGLVVSKLAP